MPEGSWYVVKQIKKSIKVVFLVQMAENHSCITSLYKQTWLDLDCS